MTNLPSGITAIVDFAESTGADPIRRCFGPPSRVLRALALPDVVRVMDEAEALARAGQWVVGYVAYEAAPAFDPALRSHPPGSMPLAWFAAYERPAHEMPAPRDHVDSPRALDQSDGVLRPVAAVSDDWFARRISEIRDYIAAGDVYQVNLTVPFTSEPSLAPLETYERMRTAQGGRYAAFLDIGSAQIMSASPELFLARSGTMVESRPMKGTAARALHAPADRTARERLLHSEKDRAENVMIVDVVRNDLGRVARVGSVTVPQLCVAERYPTVWQLTSTVTAEVPPYTPLSALFAALFPAASITGAPKIRATEIIREIEVVPRGVYCGAVGYMRPGGDACFNVAIRTAWTDDGGATLHLNAGGGVTIDSTSAGELAEVRSKVAAFTSPTVRPSLFETIRVEHGRPMRVARHLARMADSADYFDIEFDRARAEDVLHRAIAEWPHDVLGRARLVLEASGCVRATVEQFTDDWPMGRPRPVSLSPAPVDRSDVRLYHKTTSREIYGAALAAAPGMFDVVLCNSDGEATELTRGNLVGELDGARWTPPIDCGLLAGTFRAELLESREIGERIITLDDLQRAERLWFVNSLRGWAPVALVDAAGPV